VGPGFWIYALSFERAREKWENYDVTQHLGAHHPPTLELISLLAKSDKFINASSID